MSPAERIKLDAELANRPIFKQTLFVLIAVVGLVIFVFNLGLNILRGLD